jgi:hypothetical protein
MVSELCIGKGEGKRRRKKEEKRGRGGSRERREEGGGVEGRGAFVLFSLLQLQLELLQNFIAPYTTTPNRDIEAMYIASHLCTIRHPAATSHESPQPAACASLYLPLPRCWAALSGVLGQPAAREDLLGGHSGLSRSRS